MSDNNFYRAFEDKHRGSRELIKSRLEVYLPFVKKIKEIETEPNAIDLGCGRGEWLELLGENDYKVQGVDLDAGMLKACQNRGFDVVQKDAILALKELDDNSCWIVSGFHLAEHLPFEVLQSLVQEALRILKPGGLIILETPNPENIEVATVNFYLDPTHIRPIPSQFLSFLTEYYGFERTKVLKLQESKKLYCIEKVSLKNVINGVSPDYAVIAQKTAKPELLDEFNELFTKEYGLSLDSLMIKFENRLSNIEQIATQAEQIATQAEQQIVRILTSHSWKLTYPLRKIGNLLRKTLHHFPFIKSQLKQFTVKSVTYQELNASNLENEILVDITHVFRNDLKTGIQRVVRSISKELSLNLNNVKFIFLANTDGYWIYKYVDGPNQIVVPKQGDIFIGLDLNSSIVDANLAGLFKDWKNRGTKIHFIVYDILPILFPQWWEKGIGYAHEAWLQTILHISHKIFCISKAVQNDVLNYLDTHQSKIGNQPKIHWFHLGADLDNSTPSKGMPDDAESVLNQLTSKPSFLMVGTIEPRKGHLQTLLAFEKLWEDSIDVNLVIIGKQGWMVDELAAKMRNHPQLNKRLFWLEGASDEYLEKIYVASTCLIAASEGEGFGLPLIESAQKKLPIIARNIPVFREVAGTYAYYFSNDNNPTILVEAIVNWLEMYNENNHSKSDKMPWMTWEQSTQKIINLFMEKNKK